MSQTAAGDKTQASPEFVSIIVPIYNGEDGVVGLLQALKAQDYPQDRLEVLIVDNGSSDRTMQIVEDFGRAHPEWPLRLITEHERRGSYAARNKGVSVARGDILAFTDGDCKPVPGWLSTGVAAMHATGCEQIAGGVEFFFAGASPNIWEYVDSLIHLRQDIYVRDNHFGVTANLFVRAEALRQVGGFRDDLKSGGDFEFGQRTHAAGFRVAYVPEAKILHAARATHDELATKVRRVSAGLKTLADEGVLRPLSLKDLKPRRRLPEGGERERRPLLRQAQLIALVNYLHYMRIYARATAKS